MKYFFTLFFILISSILHAQSLNLKETEPALVVLNQLKNLDNLISVTEKNLLNQKSLKKLLIDYQQHQLKYLENAQDKEVTLQMVRSAYQLLESIKQNHLTHAFDTEFISQLTFFSQFATKRGIPKS